MCLHLLFKKMCFKLKWLALTIVCFTATLEDINISAVFYDLHCPCGARFVAINLCLKLEDLYQKQLISFIKISKPYSDSEQAKVASKHCSSDTLSSSTRAFLKKS